MKVVWLPRAGADLAEARACIAKHDPKAARRVADRLKETVRHLAEHPYLGRPAGRVDLREMSVPGLPYVIPYRVKEGRIELLGVFHTSRLRPPDWEE